MSSKVPISGYWSLVFQELGKQKPEVSEVRYPKGKKPEILKHGLRVKLGSTLGFGLMQVDHFSDFGVGFQGWNGKNLETGTTRFPKRLDPKL